MTITESLAKLRATLAADKGLRDAATAGPWRLRTPEEQPNGSRLGATLVETARPRVPLVSAVCEVWYAGRGNEVQDAAWIANSACPVRAQQMADVVEALLEFVEESEGAPVTHCYTRDQLIAAVAALESAV